MLEASNLGQLVGRLMRAAEEAQAGAAPQEAQRAQPEQVRALRAGSRPALIRTLLEQHPDGLRLTEICAHLGFSDRYAQQRAYEALNALPIERLGTRRKYRYRLKPVPPQEK